jgi:pimeloyl-ACP methyl ester carboxylesterase
MGIESAFVNVKGLRAHYLHAGSSGEPVVLLHGAGMDSAALSWQLIIGPLARRHKVVAPDLPGYGQTERPNVEFSNTYYTQFVIDLMNELGLAEACVVGLSLGGAVALELCLTARQRVQKLVLVGSFGLQSRVPLHKLSYVLVRMPGLMFLMRALLRTRPFLIRWSMRRIVYKATTLTDDLVNAIVHEVRRPEAGRAFESYLKSCLKWNGISPYLVPRLKEIAVPALIIHGAEDTRVPVKIACNAHALIHCSQLSVIPACGHWPPRENPDEFNKRVLGFLAVRH